MNRLLVVRIVSVLVGAAVLFELNHMLGMAIYYAIPIATIAYLAVKVGLGLLWGADEKAG